MTRQRLTARAGGSWRSAVSAGRSSVAGWRVLRARNAASEQHWRAASAVECPAHLTWGQNTPKDKRGAPCWRVADTVDGGWLFGWRLSIPVQSSCVYGWLPMTPVDNKKTAAFVDLVPRDLSARPAWFYAGAALPPLWRGAYAPPSGERVLFDLTGRYSPSPAAAVLFDLAIVRIERAGRPGIALDRAAQAVWRSPPPLDVEARSPWGLGVRHISRPPRIVWPVEPGGPVYPEPPQITIKTSYSIVNTAQLVTKHDQVPLSANGVRISMNLDSSVYGFDCELLDAASFDRINPVFGAVEVQYTINGHTFDFIVDDVSESEGEFKRWSAKGSTLSKTLTDPYAPAKSEGVAGAVSAKAAATLALATTAHDLNWPTGGDKDAADWHIPAGVFSYQNKTPLGVVKMIAAAAGAVVVPSLSGPRVLSVRPRWPVLPWKLADYPPDFLLHESMVLSRGRQYMPQGGYNEVMVSGEQYGNLTRVFRAGAGAPVRAPDIVEGLLTEHVANVQRGAQELAESVPVYLEKIETFLGQRDGDGPALYLPGSVVEMQHDDSVKNWRGLVLSCSLSADDASVTQSIEVARPI